MSRLRYLSPPCGALLRLMRELESSPCVWGKRARGHMRGACARAACPGPASAHAGMRLPDMGGWGAAAWRRWQALKRKSVKVLDEELEHL